jgi:hypothetical protein
VRHQFRRKVVVQHREAEERPLLHISHARALTPPLDAGVGDFGHHWCRLVLNRAKIVENEHHARRRIDQRPHVQEDLLPTFRLKRSFVNPFDQFTLHDDAILQHSAANDNMGVFLGDNSHRSMTVAAGLHWPVRRVIPPSEQRLDDIFPSQESLFDDCAPRPLSVVLADEQRCR